ncbi:MAG: DUF4142 domain-containing protein [Agriterribacter sp.]
MKKEFTILLVSLLLCIGACKDDDDDMNVPQVTAADRDFVMKASMANEAEINAGNLAASKATDSAVANFGSMMVMDHTQAKNRLKALADSLNIATSDTVDSMHVALMATLDTLSGRPFDSVYIHSQVTDHDVAIGLFENQKDNGDNGRLKAFAAEMLPKLMEHKAHADSISNTY